MSKEYIYSISFNDAAEAKEANTKLASSKEIDLTTLNNTSKRAHISSIFANINDLTDALNNEGVSYKNLEANNPHQHCSND